MIHHGAPAWPAERGPQPPSVGVNPKKSDFLPEAKLFFLDCEFVHLVDQHKFIRIFVSICKVILHKEKNYRLSLSHR